MAISPYQLPSPQAISPYPIEGELANKLEPQYALGLLNLYRAERQNAQGDYQDEVQAQHKYAYDQLARQMAAEKIKANTELFKIPGGAKFAQQSGVGDAIGASPEAWQGLIGATNLAQASENFQKAGAGWGSLAHAGAQVPFGLVPGLERYAGTPIGETDLVQAARIRAAASGGAGGDKGYTLTGQLPISPGTGGLLSPGISHSKVAPGDVQRVLREMQGFGDQIVADRSGVSTSLTPATPTPGSSKTTSAPPGPNRSVAVKDDRVLDTSSENGKKAQAIATMQMQRTLDDAKKGDTAAAARAKDIQNAMKGGVFTVVQKPNGDVVIKGGTGEYKLGR